MAALSEGNVFRDVVRYEDDSAGQLSREAVVVASGQNLFMGAVVGKITKTIATTGTADAGNTGGGTVASVTQGLKSKIGTYEIKCTSFTNSPEAAVFQVKDPEGNLMPPATLAAYTSDQINFDVANGSPDIAVGDKWTIVVSAGSGKVKAISLTAVDGTSEAYGIITDDCDASLADKDAVAIVKDAVIIAANLVWPDVSPAWTTDQKNAALAQLYAKGIVARAEA
jgi:hypothetical protein